jgi:hypothetical protein
MGGAIHHTHPRLSPVYLYPFFFIEDPYKLTSPLRETDLC